MAVASADNASGASEATPAESGLLTSGTISGDLVFDDDNGYQLSFGLGSRLLQHCEQEIRRLGARRLMLNVNRRNARAIAWFRLARQD